MLLQVLGNGRQWLEEPREDALVGRGDRVRGICHVKCYRPVVGVDDGFDRIADVIELQAGKCLGVWEIATRRISILHPEEPALTGPQVGALAEAAESGDGPHPLLNGTAEHDPTVAGDIAGKQQVRVLEIPREEGSASDGADGDPAGT